jgi:type IV secretory pathway protease TraF
VKIDPAPIRKMLYALLCLLAIQLLTNLYGKIFWLNLTRSEPVGLYRMEKLSREVRRGEMVIMNIPDRYWPYVYGRKWLPAGWPLLKHVGAVPGDLFCCQDTLFLINGTPIGPVYQADSAGLPLPHLKGCQEVPEGHSRWPPV